MPVFARRFCPPKYVFFSGTDITPFYNDKPQPCITSVQWTYNCNAKSAYKVNGAITMSEWMPGPLNFDNPTDASSFLDAAMKNGKGTLVLVYKDEYGHTMRRTIEGIRAITISNGISIDDLLMEIIIEFEAEDVSGPHDIGIDLDDEFCIPDQYASAQCKIIEHYRDVSYDNCFFVSNRV